MHKLNFGTSGIPLSTIPRDTINGIAQVKKLNLDSMELEFVRAINIKAEKAPLVKAAAKQHDVILTCHGQYWVNLNSKDPAVASASIQRIIDAATRAYECGAWSICFHMAFYGGQLHDIAYENIKKNLKLAIKQLQDNSIPITVRPETGGKVIQFSDIDGLIKLSQEVEQVLPCIDWAHHCARTNGKVNNYNEFKNILTKIENNLGKDALNNMHMHIEGIKYTEKGERSHLTFAESDFKYQEALKALKEFNVKGVLTCESPNIEGDALIAKKFFESI